MTKDIAAKKVPAKAAAKTNKSGAFEQLLTREDGASLDELAIATGWQPHSCRAFLTGLRKKGWPIERKKREDGTTIWTGDTIERIVRRIDLAQDNIAITVNNVGLRGQLGLSEVSSEDGAIEEIVLHCPVVKVRRGHALRLILPPSTPAVPPRARDEKLVQLVAEAHVARKLVLENPGRAVASIAADHGRCRTRLAKLVGLSCLAPDIVTAIVEGRQPAKLTAKVLTTIDLPLCWGEQRAALGF